MEGAEEAEVGGVEDVRVGVGGCSVKAGVFALGEGVSVEGEAGFEKLEATPPRRRKAAAAAASRGDNVSLGSSVAGVSAGVTAVAGATASEVVGAAVCVAGVGLAPVRVGVVLPVEVASSSGRPALVLALAAAVGVG